MSDSYSHFTSSPPSTTRTHFSQCYPSSVLLDLPLRVLHFLFPLPCSLILHIVSLAAVFPATLLPPPVLPAEHLIEI